MDAEKCSRGRQGVVLKGPMCHAKEFEVYTEASGSLPWLPVDLTYGAFKKILTTKSHLSNGVRMSGSGARHWPCIKSFIGDATCYLSWELLLLTMGDIKMF